LTINVNVYDADKGIFPKTMPSIFQKSTLECDIETGLVLFITRKLMEANGGRIWTFNSNDGIGSTFVFGLPI
jgi:signal transduction histidine kinase